MDRQIIYPGLAPLDTDLLNTGRNAMVAIGKLAGAALGTATVVNGLAVTPGAGLAVSVAPGEIYALQNVDDTPYGSLAADTVNQVIKQGLLRTSVSLSCPAPGTTGQSSNYLVQAAFSEADAGTAGLPSFSSGNPLQVWVGPLNDSTLQANVRQALCVVSVVAGVAAATGTQVTPNPAAGAIGLAVVTVANGQANITSANISQYSGASLVPQSGLASNVAHAIYTKNVAGNTDVTLTAQEAAYPLLTLTGALTGNINLIVPAVSRQRVINNQTTGAFTVTVKTAAGTGIVAPQGMNIATFCDGANVLAANSAVATQSLQGAFKNLQASATGTDTNVLVSADEITLEDGSNYYRTVRGVSLTINSAGAGANGLDSGTLSASAWYSLWVIYNPAANTVAGLLSASATAPALPAGYTHKARVGWTRTDATANKFPLSFMQSGRNVRYKVAAGSNVATIPVISSGAVGSVTVPTWVAAAVANFVPPTAGQIVLAVFSNGASGVMAAPSNAYGAYNSANTPPLVAYGADAISVMGSLVLESANIYVAGVANTQVNVLGWEDNL